MSLFLAGLLTSAHADSWKTYTDKKLGYKIQYPSGAVITSPGLNIRSNFYFDPLQPITDLQHTPGFEAVTINSHSLRKFSWPDKYLMILTMDHMPDNLLPPNAQPIVIHGKTFYQQHSWEAGMCHNYDYFTYYLPDHEHHYVFIFLLTANCFANEKQAEKRYTVNFNTAEFERILASLQLHSSK